MKDDCCPLEIPYCPICPYLVVEVDFFGDFEFWECILGCLDE